MNDEKIIILNMVEQGKISADEALKLLEAINLKEKNLNGFSVDNMDVNLNLKKSINTVFKNIGFDNDTVNNSRYLMRNESITIELKDEERPSLHFNSINDDIKVDTWDNNYIDINIRIKYREDLYREDDNFFNLIQDDERIIFYPNFNNAISIYLDLFIPDREYKDLVFTSANGSIDIQKVLCDNLKCVSLNEGIEIFNIQSEKILLNGENAVIKCDGILSNSLTIKNSNGNISLDNGNVSKAYLSTENGNIFGTNLDSNNINAYTTNGSIDMREISPATINLTSSNGKINLRELNLEKSNSVNLITSNSSIYVSLFDNSNNIYFDLVTTLGNIDIDLDNLVLNRQNGMPMGKKQVLAHSENLKDDFIKFTALNSNGSIIIK